jgi:transposase-like protein
MTGAHLPEEKKQEIKRDIIQRLCEGDHISIAAVCDAVNIPRDTLYQWRKKDPEFERELTEAKVKTLSNGLDVAETHLMKNIKADKEASIFFFLKTRGKDRGYVERSEFSGPNGGPMKTDNIVHHNVEEASASYLDFLKGR